MISSKVRSVIDRKQEQPDKFERNVKVMQSLDESKKGKKRAEKQTDTEEYDVNDDDNFGTYSGFANQTVTLYVNVGTLLNQAHRHFTDLAVLRRDWCFHKVGNQAKRLHLLLSVQHGDYPVPNSDRYPLLQSDETLQRTRLHSLSQIVERRFPEEWCCSLLERICSYQN